MMNLLSFLSILSESEGTLCFMLNHRVSKGVSQSLGTERRFANLVF